MTAPEEIAELRRKFPGGITVSGVAEQLADLSQIEYPFGSYSFLLYITDGPNILATAEIWEDMSNQQLLSAAARALGVEK